MQFIAKICPEIKFNAAFFDLTLAEQQAASASMIAQVIAPAGAIELVLASWKNIVVELPEYQAPKATLLPLLQDAVKSYNAVAFGTRPEVALGQGSEEGNGGNEENVKYEWIEGELVCIYCHEIHTGGTPWVVESSNSAVIGTVWFEVHYQAANPS